MAFGRASAKEHPNKTVGSPNQMQADQSGLRNRETYRTTRSQHQGQKQCPVCKGEHGATSCETWKKAAVNDR